MSAPSTPTTSARPRVAVWKFASCDGCQLTLLDCEDELLEVAGALDLSYFLEAGVDDGGTGTYDLSIVEGSITTAHDAERIRSVRERSASLVTIGACATAGGIQALRNFADVEAFLGIVYAHPSFISTLDTSTAIADHVPVDLELRGCPISKHQLLELIAAVLVGRRPITPGHAVCMTCKAQGNVCVTVAHGTPCFGPITHDGCGSLCPSYARGCYGCFGPSESAQVRTLADHLEGAGMDPDELALALRTFTAWAEPFRAESERRGVPVSIGRRP